MKNKRQKIEGFDAITRRYLERPLIKHQMLYEVPDTNGLISSVKVCGVLITPRVVLNNDVLYIDISAYYKKHQFKEDGMIAITIDANI